MFRPVYNGHLQALYEEVFYIEYDYCKLYYVLYEISYYVHHWYMVVKYKFTNTVYEVCPKSNASDL
jgi:hypothetical protein